MEYRQNELHECIKEREQLITYQSNRATFDYYVVNEDTTF